MKIAAIDASLSRTATCAGSSGGPDFKVGVFTSEAVGMSVAARLRRYKTLAARTYEALDSPTMVFLEGYSYDSTGRGVVSLGEYGGILRLRLLAADVEIIEVPPAMLKKFATGKGNTAKAAFQVAVARRWNVEFKGEDEYFAFALFRLGQAFLTGRADNAAQKEVIEALRKMP